MKKRRVKPRTKPRNSFGAYIRELRERLDISQSSAARMTGVDKSQWRAYENGVLLPKKRSTVEKMIRLFEKDRERLRELIFIELVKDLAKGYQFPDLACLRSQVLAPCESHRDQQLQSPYNHCDL